MLLFKNNIQDIMALAMTSATIRPTAASHEHGKNRKADDRRIRRGKAGRRAALRDARENG